MSDASFVPNYAWVGAPTAYNGTGGNGGDSGMDASLPSGSAADIRTAVVNLNQWFSPGDQAYIILCSCLVLLMPAGLALLYSGCVFLSWDCGGRER